MTKNCLPSGQDSHQSEAVQANAVATAEAGQWDRPGRSGLLPLALWEEEQQA